jgi:uncharacterized protein with HEPN domain
MTQRRDPRAYVEDILEAIANVEADTDELDFNRFAVDRRVRQLVERNVEIISEASRRLPDDIKAAEPDIPWRETPVSATSFGMIKALFGPTSCGAFGHNA